MAKTDRDKRFEAKCGASHAYALGAAVSWRAKGLRMLSEINLLNDVRDAATDIVALWENPKIAGLARSERNAAIEDSRQRLIDAIHKLKDHKFKI